MKANKKYHLVKYKKIKIKRIILIFLFLVLNITLYSKILKTPQDLSKFDKNRMPEKEIGISYFSVNASFQGVQLYQDENLITPSRKAIFLDQFFVEEIIEKINGNNTFYVFKIGKHTTEDNLSFNTQLTDLCYVNAEDLLLFNRPMINSTNGINVKVICKSSIQTYMREIKEGSDIKKIHLYDKPSFDGTEIRTVGIQNLYLNVYKRMIDDNGLTWFLVSPKKSHDLSRVNNKLKDDIDNYFGWISENHILQWENRLALKTKDGKRPYAHFYDRNDIIKMKSDIDDGSIFTNKPNNAILIDTKSTEKWTQGRFRYPVIIQPVDPYDWGLQIVEIGFLKEIAFYTESINDSLGKGEIQVYKKKARELKNISSGLNIVFVLDATYSMTPLFNSIKDVVKSVVKELKELKENSEINPALKLKIGVVLYRDKTSSKLTDSFYITSNTDFVISFMKNSNTEAASSTNNSITENLYSGILHGLNLFNNINGNNVLIVVGDTGNKYKMNEDKVASNEKDTNVDNEFRAIIEKALNNNVVIEAIHLKNNNDEREDYLTINKKFADDLKKVITSINDKKRVENNRFINSKVDEFSNNSFDKDIIIKSGNNKSDITKKLKSKIMNHIRLQQHIIEVIESIFDEGSIKQVADSLKKSNYKLSERLVSMLNNSLNKDDDLDFKKKLNYNKKPYFMEVLSIFTDKNGDSPYELQLFMLEQELWDLISEVRRLAGNMNPSNLIKFYQEKSKHISGDHPVASLQELMGLETALPILTLKKMSVFGNENITVDQIIQDIETLSENEDEQRVRDLVRKYLTISTSLFEYADKLESFYAENDDGSSERKYFWIPESLIP